ncbi:MAG: hypothetical protein N3A69_06555 [Leptospiraceae bacterium]|nr:hypothetical protein [Leptospiraceae bacterium]
MNIFKKLFGSTKLQPNLKPLRFTVSAIFKITEYLKNHPQSIFHIKVDYKENKYVVNVGFDKKELFNPQFNYPVPINLFPKDELFLRGCLLEFQSQENAFFVLPEIEVEAVDTPKKTIKKFFVNRFIISPNSELQEIILERNLSSEFSPYFVKKIFSFVFVVSFFAKENWIQIEFDKEENISSKEKEIGEFLAEYFETCGYPLLYKNNELKVEYFTSAP